MAETNSQGRTLALAVAATTWMWLMTYVALLCSGLSLGNVLFALAVLGLPAAGAIAGRRGSVMDGVKVGLVAGTLNLLLVGSIVGGDTGQSVLTQGLAWAAGLLAGSTILGTVGGAIGRCSPITAGDVDWRYRFFVVVSTLVFLMLVTGGLVTGMEAGLAVPDWPNSYGYNMLLYPLSEMTDPANEGVFFEHAHRLTGMLIGLASFLGLIAAWRWSRSPLVRWIMVVVFLLVCVQGLLGGLRVTGHLTLSQDREVLSPNLWIGVLHGVLGQTIFALLCLVAGAMSRAWRSAATALVARRADGRWCGVLVIAMLVQLVMGALYRHMSADAEMKEFANHALMGHLGVALLVLAAAVIVGVRLEIRRPRSSILQKCGRAILLLVSLQIALGVGALVLILVAKPGEGPPVAEVILTTAHQANGALLLAATLLAAGWAMRLRSATIGS